MQAIDLFAGCGGLSHGARAAGVQTYLAIEAHRAAADSFACNFPNAKVLSAKVEHVDLSKLELPRGDIVLLGGPPCQGFSSSNQRSRNLDNPRNLLYEEMLRYCDFFNPSVFIFENVYGIIEGEKRNVLSSLLRSLHKRFGSVDWKILNAVDFGVPQSRRRVFVVARRGTKPILWPKPETKQLTVRDALFDLPILENGASEDVQPYRTPPVSAYAKAMRCRLETSTGHTVSSNATHIIQRYIHIPQGGNWRDIPDTMMSSYANKSRCHTGIYRRLKDDEPSIVIGNFRKNMLVHPTQQRGLSVREAARLQSFPDNFEFCGSIGLRQQQVGNAVPPLLAAAVVRTTMNG